VTVTDLDGNGLPDLVVASVDDAAYAPDPPVSTRKNRYSLYAGTPRPFTADPVAGPCFSVIHNTAVTGRRRPPPIIRRS